MVRIGATGEHEKDSFGHICRRDKDSCLILPASGLSYQLKGGPSQLSSHQNSRHDKGSKARLLLLASLRSRDMLYSIPITNVWCCIGISHASLQYDHTPCQSQCRKITWV